MVRAKLGFKLGHQTSSFKYSYMILLFKKVLPQRGCAVKSYNLVNK